MISQQTAERIWACYREIEAAKRLLVDIAEARKAGLIVDRSQPTLKDAFGRRRHFQMGIPSGESSHRIYDVAPELGEAVIRAHIAAKTAELAEVQEKARIELTFPKLNSPDDSTNQQIQQPNQSN